MKTLMLKASIVFTGLLATTYAFAGTCCEAGAACCTLGMPCC